MREGEIWYNYIFLEMSCHRHFKNLKITVICGTCVSEKLFCHVDEIFGNVSVSLLYATPLLSLGYLSQIWFE